MTTSLKKLAGQTVIYGLSTILPRFLNYLLTPLLTYIFSKPVEYGVNTEIYAYIAFLNIVFTYGMETAFFNFTRNASEKERVYSTALISIFSSTLVLTFILLLFSSSISNQMGYGNHTNYIVWSILIIATDALMAIPFARLRLNNKAKRFALIKSVNVIINISITIFYFVFCKNAYDSGSVSFLATLYNPEIGIGYAFLANLIANIISLILLSNEFISITYVFDKVLWKKMLLYAWPLLILGLAGMINETFDRIILKKLLPDNVGQHALGVYGACYKISILMTIFIQAFRYAAEPFFFNQSEDKNAKKTNALIMKYFVIFCSFLFLGTMMNIEWIKYFVGEEYRVGIGVVPILLLANLCLGIYYNLSIWYKLTGQTKYGAIITCIGAGITLLINFTFIPTYSYMACAWATLISYATMMIISYLLGKKHYPIKYNLRSILFFLITALVLYAVSFSYSTLENNYLKIILNNLLLIVFIGLFYKLEYSALKSRKHD